MEISVIISIILVIIDQLLKFLIAKNVMFIEVIPHIFNIHRVYNYGVAFSFLENKLYLVLGISVVLIFFLFNMHKEIKKEAIDEKSLAEEYDIFGNLIDRVIHGYVIDYLEVFIFKYSFPIFNLADICITLGILILLVSMMGDRNDSRSK